MLLAALLLTGCGYGVRAEVGPTWIQDQGAGGTAQVVGLWPIVAGSGLADLWTVGGWATATGAGWSGGLLFGSELTILPGGVDLPRRKPREGFGGALRFQPRWGSSGLEFGGGLALTHGRGETAERHSIGGGGGKFGWSIDWRDVEVKSLGLAAHLSREVDETFDDPGPWRTDLLFGAEWLHVAD